MQNLFFTVNIIDLFGKPIFEVKNMYTLNSEYNIRNGYDIDHIPEPVSATLVGTVLFGEDPGNIIDDIDYKDEIVKLTR